MCNGVNSTLGHERSLSMPRGASGILIGQEGNPFVEKNPALAALIRAAR